MESVNIFTDIGALEEEIHQKYQTVPFWEKVKLTLLDHKKVIIPFLFIIALIFLLSEPESPEPVNYIGKQSGGAGVMGKIASPISSTFGMVTGVLGKLFRLLTLIITIIMIPLIPIMLYCLVAYFIIKKFLFMFTSLK